MRALRTPDDRFSDLPDYPFAPRYVEVPSGDGGALRMHYVDSEGPLGPPVLMLHGEPTWSFLYRKVIPVIGAAGRRAIAPDLIGFGRSDKPAERGDYTYQRHIDWLRAFLDALGLESIDLLCHDWGGLLGLRLVAEQPDRFRRVLITNTGLPTGDRAPVEAFVAWRSFADSAPDFSPGSIVARFNVGPLSPEVAAAYDAPFPDETFKAGARQFPQLVPTTPDDPESAPNRAAWESLARFDKPLLTVFGDSDPFTAGVERYFQRKVPGAAGQPHRILKGAGHYIQEDAGDELAQIAASFFA